MIMEEKAIVAYQGKSFKVTLQSMIGSTNYGWCLMSMPAGIVLAGQVNEPTAQGIAPVNQVFYFIAVDVPAKGNEVDLKFGMYCLSQVAYPFKPKKAVTIKVKVIPCNADNGAEDKFVKYSEGHAYYENDDLVANLKYGYPCSLESQANLKYGYPCTPEGQANFKYGYPCTAEGQANFKYGYPCTTDSQANLKYGYPCLLKYGFPNCTE
jgi:hypothetical protein